MTLPVFITVIADHDKPQPSGCLLDIFHNIVRIPCLLYY
ncbi:hemolysin activation protein [Escherichia coli]|nr:hemolysin activation protein [Escherichia coli]